MSRELDTATLDLAAEEYAGQFLLPTVNNPFNPSFAPIGGRGWVIASLYNLHYKDEFEYLKAGIRDNLGAKAQARFDEAAAAKFSPRDDALFHSLLEERLATDEHGKPISGKVGSVVDHSVTIGFHFIRSKTYFNAVGEGLLYPGLIHTDVHVGETDEEATLRRKILLEKEGVVLLPLSQMPATMALNTRISNLAAKRACDAVVDSIDDGSAAGVGQGRTGAQPADPDTATTGTNLFTLVYTDPAFGNAADANPGGRATASAITSDTSADATGTLGYYRVSSSNDAITPLTAVIDGEAGTSGADINFNTLAIVSGATVAMTSHTVTEPES